MYVFACYFLNQYYLVSHLTKNHTILRNHTNHYKIKPLPYHTIWGPPVEITFIILFFCILTPNSSWNYYLYISGNSNGLWLNYLWFSAVFLNLFKKFNIELVSQNIRRCVRNKLLLLRKFFCCNWKLTCNLFSIHYLLV